MMRSYFFVTLGSVSVRTYSVRLTVTLKKQQPKTGENLSEDNKLIWSAITNTFLWFHSYSLILCALFYSSSLKYMHYVHLFSVEPVDGYILHIWFGLFLNLALITAVRVWTPQSLAQAYRQILSLFLFISISFV